MNRIQVAFFLLFFCSPGAVAHSGFTDSLISELKKDLPDSTRVKVYILLKSQSQISRDSMIQFAGDLMRFAENQSSDSLHLIALQSAYAWFKSWDDRKTSLELCWKFLDRVEKNRYDYGIASACKFLGVLHLYHSLDSSMYYHLRCIDYFRKAGYEKGASAAKINLGAIYYMLKQYQDCINVTLDALAFQEKISDWGRIGTCSVNLGEAYRELGHCDQALTYFTKSLLINNRHQYDDYGYAHAHFLMAEVFIIQGKLKQAAASLDSALQTGKRKNRADILYMAYNGYAKLKMAMHDWNGALADLRLSEMYRADNLETEKETCLLFYEAYRAKGDYRNALESYLLYISARDSLQSEERVKTLDGLEARYQNKEKKAQIELLNKENEIKHAAAERQMLIRNVVIGLAVILLFFGILLVNRIKLKKKIEKQEALLAERKRISRELHDDLGAQLSTAKMFLQSINGNGAAGKGNQALENTLSLIESSINDLRKIMYDLQTSTLQERGYIAATEELVNKINEFNQISFTLSHHGLDNRLDRQVEHHLFRITQELVNNTLKYAQAGNITISLMIRNERIIWMYEDDGIGFDMKNLKRGYGLSNIESRAEAAGGSIEIDSMPGAGFRATVELALVLA